MIHLTYLNLFCTMIEINFDMILTLVRGKIGVEPSIMELTDDSSDLIMKHLKNKTKLWYHSILTDEGTINDLGQLLQYDVGIYIFKNCDKVFILYAAQNKGSVDFLVKNIYKQIKNNDNGNNK